jgi:SAM-dependent methyltransferase
MDASSVRLQRMVNAAWHSQAVYVAAVLDIASLLRNGPKSSAELARETSSHADALYRLLRALAAVGVFRELSERRFENSPLSEVLRADHKEQMRDWTMTIGESRYWSAWGALLHSVRTGENAFEHVHGISAWADRMQRPEIGATFDRAMSVHAGRAAEAIAAAAELSRFREVVDVGGGEGRFLAAALRTHESLRGVLFDLPRVVARAGALVESTGRCRVVGGDFLAGVPAGGDAYVLMAVLHNWEDSEAQVILRNIRGAIAPNGRLLVVESELEPANLGPAMKAWDLNMLVVPGGRERTAEEYDALFRDAGFERVSKRDTTVGRSIIECAPRSPV